MYEIWTSRNDLKYDKTTITGNNYNKNSNTNTKHTNSALQVP